MSPELVGVIGVAVMLFLMALGVPVCVCMALVGLVGYAVIAGINPALVTAGIVPFSETSSYVFTVLPLFLLLGEFVDMGGLMQKVFRGANTLLGALPGGLAMASITGAAIFSSVSGSSMSCAALMTKVALPSLLDDYKYDPKLATGALMAGGTLGNLVPPGNGFIFYAIMTDTSVGKLYMASIIPGILLTIMYLVQIYLQVKLNPSLAPVPGISTNWKQKLLAIKDMWELTFLFILIMGGIWFGVFTATEAAAVGTVFAFIFVLFKKAVNRQNLNQAFNNTLRTTGMAIAIIIGAMIYTYFTTITNLPGALSKWIVDAQLSPIVVIIMMMVVYSILGTAMDTLSMLFLSLPIFVGVVTACGFDLYWFGVLVITQMEFSNITPPVGMNIFVVAELVKDRNISTGTLFKATLPFCITMLVFNVLLIAFPKIALFMVDLMKK